MNNNKNQDLLGFPMGQMGGQGSQNDLIGASANSYDCDLVSPSAFSVENLLSRTPSAASGLFEFFFRNAFDRRVQ